MIRLVEIKSCTTKWGMIPGVTNCVVLHCGFHTSWVNLFIKLKAHCTSVCYTSMPSC